MPAVVISRETHAAIVAAALLPFRDTARPLPGGRFEIELDEAVLTKLGKIYSDPDVAIQAVLAAAAGKIN